MTTSSDFADYCCELLSRVGPCVPKRMFGGFGIRCDGLAIAIIADLGSGEKLWLKADDGTRAQYEAAGCAKFIYEVVKNGVGKSMSMNYYSAPAEAMDASEAMRPWASIALQCAVRTQAGKRPGKANGAKLAPALAQTNAARPSALSQRSQAVSSGL